VRQSQNWDEKTAATAMVDAAKADSPANQPDLTVNTILLYPIWAAVI